MIKAKYDFDPDEQKHLEEFRQRLRELDQKFNEEGINFMPLDKIGVSVQF